jgi:3-methyladenine DNA glycosylase AlkD
MGIEEKLAEIRSFCEAHADPARVEKYSRYFVEGYDAFGLDQATQESQRDVWLAAWGLELDLEGFLALGDQLVATGTYEEATFAIWFAEAQSAHFGPATLDRVGRWLDDGLRNWAHVDTISAQVIGPHLIRGAVTLDDLMPWRNATSRWKRRAVPVSLIRVLKAGGDVDELLAFVEPMLHDPEKVVHQGLGWFLREVWKKQPEPVERLLLKVKNTCPRLIVQYATERMTPEHKERFRRTEKVIRPRRKKAQG